MAVEWTHLRIPKVLHDRLTARAAEILTAYQERGGNLPPEYCERVPLHHVIERALDELDGHHARAKKQQGRNTNKSKTGRPRDGMLTPLAPAETYRE
jgi:hypothetical protein